MVTPEIWNTYGLGGCVSLPANNNSWFQTTPDGQFLCMNCLEKRLGRKLQKADLMDALKVNLLMNLYTSKLLI